jgi:hypothetical protein
MYFCWVKTVDAPTGKAEVKDGERQANREALEAAFPPRLERVQGLFGQMHVCGVKPPPDKTGGGPTGIVSPLQATTHAPAPDQDAPAAPPDTPLAPLGLLANFMSGRARLLTDVKNGPDTVATQLDAVSQSGLDFDEIGGARTLALGQLQMQVGGIDSLGAWSLLDAGSEAGLDMRMLCRPVLGTLQDALAWRASNEGQAWFESARACGLMTFASISC